MTIATPSRAAIAAATTALLLASCGGGSEVDQGFLDQSPRAITKAAFEEMHDVTSVRILGSVRSADGRARIDVRVDDEGRCAGSVGLARGRAQFIHTAEATWLKADEDFWRASSPSPQQAKQVMARLGTSWAKVPDNTTDFEGFCDLEPMLSGFTARKDGGEGRLSKGDVEVIGETQAIAISEKGGGQSSTVWVAVTSPHRVVKIVSREGGDPTAISFEEFGLEVNAEAPEEDDVVDLTASAPTRKHKG